MAAAAAAAPKEAAGTELEALEKALTAQVPALLDAMNRSSSEVNTLERQLGESQDRYKKLLEQWSRLYEDLRAQHGIAIDRVRPYFEAAQVFNAASRRVQVVVREFSAAASLHAQAKTDLRAIENSLAYGAHKVALDADQQDGLSRATVHVLKCQQERERREQEYACALREYKEAKEALEVWKTQIGESTIKRTLPSFRQLQKHQTTLANEQGRINSLTERTKQAKQVYHHSMRELDRINNAVHNARREHAAAGGGSSSSAASAASQTSQTSPASQVAGSPPEESPEVPEDVEEDTSGIELTRSSTSDGGAGCRTEAPAEREESPPELSPELSPELPPSEAKATQLDAAFEPPRRAAAASGAADEAR